MSTDDKSLVTVARQLGAFAIGLSAKQKLWMAGGTFLVAATLFLFVRVMAKPEMKSLYTGMEPAEAQALVARLEARDIKAQISPDGSAVSVPADQLNASRLEVASQPMPQRGRLGFELFDKTNWASTDFDDKVNYQRALEGELERTIQTLDGVSSCRVHLALPPETIFTERERHAKATVVLHVRKGTLTGSTQLAITRLVAGAVDNLQPENVSVIDGETNRPLNDSASMAGDLASGPGIDEVLSQRLVKTLEPVVGEGRIRASVRVEFDANSSEENQDTYDPNSAIALTSQKSEQRSGAGMAGGIPGTASNLPGTSKAVESASDASYSKTDNSTFGVNRTTRHTVHPAGQVKRITAALLIDDEVRIQDEKGKKIETRQKRPPEQLKQIEELAKASLAMDTTRGDLISVQNISFLTTPTEEIPRPGIREKVRSIQNDWATSIRVVAVLLLFFFVYLTMLRPVKRQILLSMNSPVLARAAREPKLPVANSAPALELQDASPEQRKVGNLVKHLNQKVKAEPVASTRLVQSWIKDGEAEG